MIFLLLASARSRPIVILIGAVTLLLLTGMLTPGEALAGMSNEGMITVGVLFVVGAAVRETGGVDFIAARLFGRPKTPTRAIAPHHVSDDGSQRLHEQHAARGDADSGRQRLGAAESLCRFRSS